MSDDERAVLITAAQDPLDEQHRQRVRRYIIVMSMRIPALVIAGIVYASTGLWWLAFLIVGLSLPLPWIAVLIANDRPARRKDEVQRYKYAPTRRALSGPDSDLPVRRDDTA